MKHIKNLLLYITMLFTFSSCADFLDQVPDEILSEAVLFESKDDVVRVLTQIYYDQPQPINVYPSADYTTDPGIAGDDVDFNWSNYGPHYKDMGLYSPSNPIFRDGSSKTQWKRYYQAIRLALYFLDRIDECKDPKLTDEERRWWKGEAYFLQAYYYFKLLTFYGPVPVIDRVYDPNQAEEDGISRASFDACVGHIDGLLELAYSHLDLFYTFSSNERAGRASKAAAKFLQARLWLYAASPLYNGMKNPDTNKDYSYLNPKTVDGEPLISTTASAEKWKKAIDVAAEAIEVCENAGLGLFMPDDVTTGTNQAKNGYSAYWNVMTYSRGGAPNKENVFYRQNFTTTSMRDHSLPLSWSGYSGVCPLIEHVNEYFMANGRLPEDDSDYQGLAITQMDSYSADGKTISIPRKYKKRDPRFYANILFPGQYSYAVTGNQTEATNQRWSYKNASAFDDRAWFRPFNGAGRDGRDKMTGRDYCNTGFLVIKFTGKTADASSKGDCAVSTFRLAELYLNYTEAAFEYAALNGNPASSAEVFTYWDKIRERVQIPKVKDAYAAADLTTAKLRQLIHREREIELAFEGHRYYDNRRWLIAEREGGPKHGLDVYKAENEGFWNESFVLEERVWDDKMYFFPIPQTEIDKNPKMTQNERW
ncbi:MAG: RagB/SusD family nutrient uptake outer membrane protein [Prevotella sp.]|jgi:hypothetical protein|nr:RagB/SusD family nutrient uptake outer membrane protein [Prevotella sp.]